MPNKGFALVAAGQFETRLQELGLQGSYLDGSWQAMPSITTFLSCQAVMVGLRNCHFVRFFIHFAALIELKDFSVLFREGKHEKWCNNLLEVCRVMLFCQRRQGPKLKFAFLANQKVRENRTASLPLRPIFFLFHKKINLFHCSLKSRMKDT